MLSSYVFFIFFFLPTIISVVGHEFVPVVVMVHFDFDYGSASSLLFGFCVFYELRLLLFMYLLFGFSWLMNRNLTILEMPKTLFEIWMVANLMDLVLLLNSLKALVAIVEIVIGANRHSFLVVFLAILMLPAAAVVLDRLLLMLLLDVLVLELIAFAYI